MDDIYVTKGVTQSRSPRNPEGGYGYIHPGAQPFTAPEVHGWAVYDPPQGFEVVAESGYIQALRSQDGRVHGMQFHPEIKVPYNQAESVLRGFLEDTLAQAK